MGKHVLRKVLLMWFTTKNSKSVGWWYRSDWESTCNAALRTLHTNPDRLWVFFIDLNVWPSCLPAESIFLASFLIYFLLSSHNLEPWLSHLQPIISHNIFPHKGNKQWSTVSSIIQEYIFRGLRKQGRYCSISRFIWGQQLWELTVQFPLYMREERRKASDEMSPSKVTEWTDTLFWPWAPGT